MPSNYETALKAEAKRVVRCFQSYDVNQRANHMASNCNIGRHRRVAEGEFFYTHPDVPGIAFRKRFAAAEYALEQVSA